MIKVLYILSNSSQYDGSSKSFLSMLDGLGQYDVEPHIVLLEAGDLQVILEQKGISTYVLQHAYRFMTYPPVDSFADALLFLPRLVGRLWLAWRAVCELDVLTDTICPDIIHSNVSVIDVGYRVAKRKGIPHLWHIREYGQADFGLRYIPSTSRYFKRFQEQYAYSVCITKSLRHYHSLETSPYSRVVYNAVELPQGEDLHIPERYFLYVGRIKEQKGVLDLIAAYSRYHAQADNPIRLYLAGTGDVKTMRKLTRYLQRAGLTKDVLLLNNQQNIRSYYEQAEMVIVPSQSEAFGRVMPEAMLCGALVASRDTAGSKEQLDNGCALMDREIGLRFHTQAELTRLLLHVSRMGKAHYADMTTAARRCVSILYTKKKHAKEIYQIYQLMLRK